MSPYVFFEIVDDLSVFEFRQFNLFKVFYADYVFNQQIGRQGRGWRKRKSDLTLRQTLARLANFFIAILRVISIRLSHPRQTQTLFYGAAGRVASVNNIIYDLYNGRIITEKGKAQFIVLEDFEVGVAKTYSADLFISHFSPMIKLASIACRAFMSKEVAQFGKRLASRYPELNYTADEAARIVIGFYSNHLIMRFLLAALAPKQLLMTCHYGREAIISAAKCLTLPLTELMHGAVADNPFYIYPEGVANMFQYSLFPDRLAVYGPYWCEQVLAGNMFPADTVEVVGYFLMAPEKQMHQEVDERTLIFITSQPTVQEEIANYINFLKTQLDPAAWRIFVQPHPNENPQIFETLLQTGFIEFATRGTYESLAECDIHISVYSTVLYEALRYDVANYSLVVDRFRERCETITSAGVACILHSHELPDAIRRPSADVSFFFADYDPAVLFAKD